MCERERERECLCERERARESERERKLYVICFGGDVGIKKVGSHGIPPLSFRESGVGSRESGVGSRTASLRYDKLKWEDRGRSTKDCGKRIKE